MHESDKQTKVKLLKQFGEWSYNVRSQSVSNRMPWFWQRKGILTTSRAVDFHWFGTIVSANLDYNPAPWIMSKIEQPGIIWYWINEDDCSLDRNPGNIAKSMRCYLFDFYFMQIHLLTMY